MGKADWRWDGFALCLFALSLAQSMTGIGNDYLGFALFYAVGVVLLIKVVNHPFLATRLEWPLRMLVVVMLSSAVIAATAKHVDSLVQARIGHEIPVILAHTPPPSFPILQFSYHEPPKPGQERLPCAEPMPFRASYTEGSDPRRPYQAYLEVTHTNGFPGMYYVRIYSTAPITGGLFMGQRIGPTLFDDRYVGVQVGSQLRSNGNTTELIVNDWQKFKAAGSVWFMLNSAQQFRVVCVGITPHPLQGMPGLTPSH